MPWDYYEKRNNDIDDSNDLADSSDLAELSGVTASFGDVIPEEDFNGDSLASSDSIELPDVTSSHNDIIPEEEFDVGVADEASLDLPEEDQGPILRRDPTELWQSGVSAIDDVIESMRDDLRDKGMEDGAEMEAIVMHERTLQLEELSRNIEGDFSQPYTPPDFSSFVSNPMDNEPTISPADTGSTEIADLPLDDTTVLVDNGSPIENIETLDEEALWTDYREPSVDDSSSAISEILTEEALDDLSDDSSIKEDLEIATSKSESPTFPENSAELQDGAVDDISRVNDVSKWLGDINPNFDAFDPESPYCNNCGSCAFAVFQRFEGNTDICASADNIGDNKTMEALTGMDQVSMSPAEIEKRLLAEGDGAHAIIGIDRAEGPGHWFNAACINGKVVAIDGQNGEIHDWPPDYGDVVNWDMSINRR